MKNTILYTPLQLQHRSSMMRIPSATYHTIMKVKDPEESLDYEECSKAPLRLNMHLQHFSRLIARRTQSRVKTCIVFMYKKMQRKLSFGKQICLKRDKKVCLARTHSISTYSFTSVPQFRCFPKPSASFVIVIHNKYMERFFKKSVFHCS